LSARAHRASSQAGDRPPHARPEAGPPTPPERAARAPPMKAACRADAEVQGDRRPGRRACEELAMAKPQPKETVRFPNESDEYRAARAELLEAETDLRRRVEEVAAHRRRLPLGGEIAEDYLFEEGPRDLRTPEAASKIRFSQLFEPGKDTLVVYSFMYGPQMEKPCPMCPSLLDGLDGQAPHVTQRVNLVVAAKAPVRRIREHARARGWPGLALLSAGGTPDNRDE